MYISDLVSKGDQVYSLVIENGDSKEIFGWLTESQFYLEHYHSKMEITKDFIKYSRQFINQKIKEDTFNIKLFNLLLTTIKGAEKINIQIENERKEQLKFFDELNG